MVEPCSSHTDENLIPVIRLQLSVWKLSLVSFLKTQPYVRYLANYEIFLKANFSEHYFLLNFVYFFQMEPKLREVFLKQVKNLARQTN
jgi:hypothetical protein